MQEFRHQVEDGVMIEAKELVDRGAAGCIQVTPGSRFVLSTPVRP
jgi:hypothetical protein